MQIFIMRHGEAQLHAPSDAERPLTSQGEMLSTQAAAWLGSKVNSIDLVLVSPYLRAQQTLAAVRLALPLPANAEVLPELTPGGDERRIASYLHALGEQHEVKSVLLISHLPLVGNLVSELCPQLAPPMFVTSAIACVELGLSKSTGELGIGELSIGELSIGKLQWMYRP